MTTSRDTADLIHNAAIEGDANVFTSTQEFSTAANVANIKLDCADNDYKVRLKYPVGGEAFYIVGEDTGSQLTNSRFQYDFANDSWGMFSTGGYGSPAVDGGTLVLTNTAGHGSSVLGEGALIQKWVGDTDSLELRNMGAGDYSLLNPQQDNGLVIYDGTAGVTLVYDGGIKLTANSGGVDVTGALDVSTTATIQGALTVNSVMYLSAVNPSIRFEDTDGATDAAKMNMYWYENGFLLRAMNDNDTTKLDLMSVDHSGKLTMAGAVEAGGNVTADDNVMIGTLGGTGFHTEWDATNSRHKHHITYNDGGGNFNIRMGNVYDSGTVCTEASYPMHIAYNQTNGTITFNMMSTSKSVGDSVTFDEWFTFDRNGNFACSGEVTDSTGWTNLTLVNSWANFGSPYPTAQYRKGADGVVEIKGLVKNGTATDAQIAVLPAGFRPGETRIFRAASAVGYARMDVGATGGISFPTGGSTIWSSIECTFKAGN